MARIIITITKASPDQKWLILNSRQQLFDNFSKEDIANILIPYRDHVKAWPGLLSTNNNILSDTVMEVVHTFDTLENAQNAYNDSMSTDVNSIIVKHKELMIKKQQELGLEYTYNVTVTD